MKRQVMALLAAAVLLLGLASCGGKAGEGEDSAGGADTASVSGIVNRLGDFLTLLTEDGDYVVFDFGRGVDAAGLEEGDSVTVSYTGELDSEEEPPVAVSITKD